jgi:hypothetical protein
MKTLFLKGLLVLGFVFGLSAIACAQDDEKQVVLLRKTETATIHPEIVKKHLAKKEAAQSIKGSTKKAPREGIPVIRYEEYQLKKEVE